MTTNISPRQQVAMNLADTCVCGDLNDSYGVSCEKTQDAKQNTYWSVLFCKARHTDGVIRVYSPNFIMITWQTANRLLPRNGKEIFRSESSAKSFLIKTFVAP